MKSISWTAAQLGCLVLLSAVAQAQDAAPPLVPIQGELADSDGNAISGTHSIGLHLYDSETGGTSLYTETHAAIEVDNGFFYVYLGSGDSDDTLSLDLFQQQEALWLEVVVDGVEVIEPRFELGSVPYAGFAQHCGDAATLEGNTAADFARAPTRMRFWRGGGDSSNVINFVDAEGTQHQITVNDASVEVTGNTHIAYYPASSSAISGADGILLFNIEGSVSRSCTLLHSEDDTPAPGYYFATDAGNSGINENTWGDSETLTFMFRREGAANLPMASSRQFEIICF